MSKKILIRRFRIVAFSTVFSTYASLSSIKDNIQLYAALEQLKKQICEAPLNPQWVTGFTDAEGCFCLSITENKKYKLGREVKLVFSIELKEIDKDLLVKIKIFFGCGSINYNKNNKSYIFSVRSLRELKIIIDHFNKYALISDKYSDFKLFSQCFNLIELKEHLILEGLHKMVAFKASINLGLSEKLKSDFDVVPVPRPIVKRKKIQYPHWVAGFTTGEGSYIIEIAKKEKSKLGYHVRLVFILTQHVRDEQLIKSLIKYFDCGYVVRKGAAFDFKVTKFSDISDKIIPFFQKFPILGVKALDFEDWCKVAQMIKDKKHLTQEGLEEIKKIKAGMNLRRE